MRSPTSFLASDVGAPLRVVHVCRVGWPHAGGMEAVIGGLASALVRRGHDVRVLTLDRAPDGPARLPGGVYGGVVYERLPRLGPARYPFTVGLAPRLRGAEIVHVHGVDGLLHQALAARGPAGPRIGVTPHGAFLHTRRSWMIKQIWLRTGAAAALRAADAVWYTSDAERTALAPAGVGGTILPDGVDVARFADLQRSPEAGRWLVLGRVDVHKGLDLLIDRLGAVAARDDRPFKLRVVGPEAAPGLVDDLRRRAVARGIGHRVSFVGALDAEALRMELARCELALFPSRFEAFGLALVEAMAAGVPVVVNDIPAFRERVVDGETGWIVDFARSDAARRLRRLRGGLPARNEAAVAAAAPFGWDRRVEAWEAAYRALLGAP